MKRDVSLLIIVNKEKKVLLQHRAENLERWPGYWGLFGGGIDDGETPEEGLRREIGEELGYKVDNHKLLFIQEYGGKTHFGTRYVYICSHDEEQEFILCSESQAYDWFHFEDLENLKIHESDYKTIKKLVEEPGLLEF